ncbi:MAG: adenylyl-sulfate kinase [Rhodospirillaceae bacterium]|nr:adenylyl-sulfate kinase [Rhodospirillaceae bacterium]
MTGTETFSAGAFPIVIVGHVDHGKSTLIGRLLNDTGSLPDGKAEELRQVSQRRGGPVEWSFALDSLQLERDQAITIDSTQIWFTSAARRYVIIDAPGHGEFLRNMITGAAQAEAAVIVVDAVQGLTDQTKRHAYLLHLLGVTKVILAVNKMDKVAFDEKVYARLKAESQSHLGSLGLALVHAVPIAAREGDNLAQRSPRMPWWHGPTLIEALDALPRRRVAADQPFRLAVQDVYRDGEERIVVGRIEAGRLRIGDAVRFWPTGRTARIKSFQGWSAATPILGAAAPQSVAFTLDDDLFVERGHVAAEPERGPRLSAVVRVRVFWLGQGPLAVGRSLTLRVGTAVTPVRVTAIHRVLDVADLAFADSSAVATNDIAEISLSAATPLTFDLFRDHDALGRGVLIDGQDVVAGCVIDADDAATAAHVGPGSGAVIWLAGLSGAGKTTLAAGLRRELAGRGVHAVVLDGDVLRRGLNADLGFSPLDRAENLRRAAELAKLLAADGAVVIAALISPTAADRRRVREIVGAGFHEVFVNADLATCEARDVKGLYAKARAGEVGEFTGVSGAWEPPTAPDLELNTALDPVETCVRRLTAYVESRVLLARATISPDPARAVG